MRNAQGICRCAPVMGTAILMMLTGTAAPAQTFRVIHSFEGPPDGAGPVGGLIRDAAGNLYGTTSGGGDASCSKAGCGTVFKLSLQAESVLYSFAGGFTDGAFPEDALVRDSAGNLYGTTTEGGGGGPTCSSGCGSVFKIDTTGKETLLYGFTGPPDGSDSLGGLVRDSAGNLYGTTYSGGDFICQCGTVFKVDPSGNETVLYSFTGGLDGANPVAGLIHDSMGNLYGTTYYGGSVASCDRMGCGTVFKVDRAGNETVLYRFTGGSDGGEPIGGLLRDTAGNFYGTTAYGGSVSYCGTVFKLDSSGTETVLYNFTCRTDGGIPSGGVVMDAAGNLYGTTSSFGGDPTCQAAGNLCGTVFKLTATGTFSVLHTFTGGEDGGWSQAGLVMDPAGNLYGTAFIGGSFNEGVVFGIKP